MVKTKKPKRVKVDFQIDTDNADAILDWQVRFGRTMPKTGKWRIRLDPVGDKRSNRSNSYYFVAVVATLVQYSFDQGDTMDKNTAHETLKRECGLWTENENPALNHPISWADYDQESGTAYIDRCIGWLAQMGQPVPPPIVLGYADKWDVANPPNRVPHREEVGAPC